MIDLDKWDKLLDPRTDPVFRRMFSDSLLLSEMLSDVLGLEGDSRLAHVNVYLSGDDNPEQRKHPEDKAIVLDVRAEDSVGNRYNVEIQLQNQYDMGKRAVYYNARLFSGILTKGLDYSSLPKAVTVIITDYRQFPMSEDYRQRFSWWDDRKNILLTDRQEIVFLDLSVIEQLHKRKLMTSDQRRDRAIKWMLFLLAKKNKEISLEVERMRNEDPVIEMALRSLERISSDPKVLAEYESRLKLEMDQAALLSRAKQEGLQQGMQQGIEQGMTEKAKQTARTALAEGLPMNLIIKLSGLKEEEILELQKNFN